VSVSTLTGCVWSASSDVSWISAGGAPVTGSGSAELIVEENTGRARVGTAKVAGLMLSGGALARPAGGLDLARL
jgi:hypothetical protein